MTDIITIAVLYRINVFISVMYLGHYYTGLWLLTQVVLLLRPKNLSPISYTMIQHLLYSVGTPTTSFQRKKGRGF